MKNILKTALVSIFLSGAIYASAESEIIIYDSYPYKNVDLVTFNGKDIKLGERPFYKKKMQLDVLKKGVSKYIIKEEGPIIIARDFTWFEKPYHDEMTIDVVDGETYYIELLTGIHNKLKLMSDKDIAKLKKEMEKKSEEFEVFEDQVYEE